jgi:hypothetical protein
MLKAKARDLSSDARYHDRSPLRTMVKKYRYPGTPKNMSVVVERLLTLTAMVSCAPVGQRMRLPLLRFVSL